MAEDFLDNPFEGLSVPSPRGTSSTIRYTGAQAPSDLNRDELGEMEWWRKFYDIFRPYIEDQDFGEEDRLERMDAARRWLKALTDYNEGKIELEDLKKVDVDIFSEIPGWSEYYTGIVGEPAEEPAEEGADPFQSLYDKYGKDIVDDAREKYDEIVKVLGEAAEDPFGAIEKIIGTVSSGTTECKEANLPDWVRNCVTVGVLYGIPGLPLPPIPGVMGTTIGELEEGLKNVGRKFEDIINGAKTCGEEGNEECTWQGAIGDLKDWVLEKAGDAIDDITDPDAIGGWVTGILGPVLGGLIFSEIGDQLEDIFFPVTDITVDDTTKCTEGTLDENGNCICPDGLIENADGSCTREPVESTTCDDPAADNFGEKGECQYPASETPYDSSYIDELCSKPRPEGYSFETQNWDRYCSDGATIDDGGGGAGDSSQCNQDNPASTPLECGWVECPEGGFAPTVEECGTDAEVTLGPALTADGGAIGGGGSVGGGGFSEGMLKGLSYQAQPLPAIQATPQIDYAADLDQLIARQLQQRMLT